MTYLLLKIVNLSFEFIIVNYGNLHFQQFVMKNKSKIISSLIFSLEK